MSEQTPPRLIEGLKSQSETAERVAPLRTEFENLMAPLGKVKGDEKLGAMRALKISLAELEFEATKNPQFLVADLRELRLLLPQVEAAISRCEAGQKKRQENAAKEKHS